MILEYLEKEDVYVTYVKMPMRIKGFCKNVNGAMCAVINSDLAPDVLIKTVKHELNHINKDDLQSDQTVKDIEYGA